MEKIDSCHDGREVFRIAKQKFFRAVKVSVDDRKKIWKEHMDKLMNVENEWSHSIDASKAESTGRRIEVEESYENRESKWDLWDCYIIV